MILRTSSSHEEGVIRDWSINTKRFIGKNGKVTELEAVRLEWVTGDNGRPQMKEVAGSEFRLDARSVRAGRLRMLCDRPGWPSSAR